MRFFSAIFRSISDHENLSKQRRGEEEIEEEQVEEEEIVFIVTSTVDLSECMQYMRIRSAN
jgi:hypothetical protein